MVIELDHFQYTFRRPGGYLHPVGIALRGPDLASACSSPGHGTMPILSTVGEREAVAIVQRLPLPAAPSLPRGAPHEFPRTRRPARDSLQA